MPIYFILNQNRLNFNMKRGKWSELRDKFDQIILYIPSFQRFALPSLTGENNFRVLADALTNRYFYSCRFHSATADQWRALC